MTDHSKRVEALLAEHDAILSQEHVPQSAGERLQQIEDECLVLLGESLAPLPWVRQDES